MARSERAEVGDGDRLQYFKGNLLAAVALNMKQKSQPLSLGASGVPLRPPQEPELQGKL